MNNETFIIFLSNGYRCGYYTGDISDGPSRDINEAHKFSNFLLACKVSKNIIDRACEIISKGLVDCKHFEVTIKKI